MVTFLVVLNVDDGTICGCCLEANDHDHFLKALSRLVRCYPRARRQHLILDYGSSPISQATTACWASHPHLRAFYTPPHARWRNQGEWLVRTFSDIYRQRVDSQSCQYLIGHLEASWPESKRRFAHSLTWSWSCCVLYVWARKKGTAVCTKAYTTIP
jgi:DDE superfamily endonuclease